MYIFNLKATSVSVYLNYNNKLANVCFETCVMLKKRWRASFKAKVIIVLQHLSKALKA